MSDNIKISTDTVKNKARFLVWNSSGTDLASAVAGIFAFQAWIWLHDHWDVNHRLGWLMKQYQFRIECQVRDYECDMQGHVNHAVYLHYLEHCRHEFLKEHGLEFVDLVRRGISLVIIRAELDYKYSLQSGDRFMVGAIIERVSPLRYRFLQDVYLLPENRLVLKARVTGTGVNAKGRPEIPEEITAALDRMT